MTPFSGIITDIHSDVHKVPGKSQLPNGFEDEGDKNLQEF
jgi:hypothetical protein